MKLTAAIFLLMACLSGSLFAQIIRAEEPIRIIEVRVTNERFDLSGICAADSSWYVVADKPRNHFLYKIDTNGNSASLQSKTDIALGGILDIEGVDYSGRKFFFIEERQSRVFLFHKKQTEQIPIQWGEFKPDTWGNRGFEGIAADEDKKLLFIGKERQPAKLFKLPITGGPIIEVFKGFSEKYDFHVSDIKIEGEYLYVLDRKNYRILKLDRDKEILIRAFDYSHILNHKGQKFYRKARYPMAEALLLTKSEIVIGLDNNGDSFNSDNRFVKQSELEGINPVIIIFERPEFF